MCQISCDQIGSFFARFILGDEQLAGVRGALDRVGHDGPLVGVEPAEHVVGQIAPRVAASDPDPQPSELGRAQLRR